MKVRRTPLLSGVVFAADSDVSAENPKQADL